MTTFTKQFGTAPPRDLFYPNVLTPTLEIDASKVQDAFRRAFDMLYKINPPPGSREHSSVLDTFGFIDEFTVNLANNIFLLSGENWNSSTAGVSWNQHTLTYHGTAYTIAAGGPTTNKYIYWSLDNANIYQTSATFPDLSFINPADGSVASGLVAVWNSSDGKLYPFWSAKMAPLFVSTALIEDLAVSTAKIQDLSVSTAKIANLAATTAKINDLAVTTAKINDLAVTNAKINDLSATKITTGTLAASVAITLTQSDSTPAELDFGTQARMFCGSSTYSAVTLIPTSDYTNQVNIGGSTGSAFQFIQLCAARNDGGLCSVDLRSWDANVNRSSHLSVKNNNSTTSQVTIGFGTSRGSFTDSYVFDSSNLTLFSTNIVFNSSGGIKDSSSSSSFVVTSTVAQIYANSATLVGEFGTSNLKLYVNGGFRTVLIDSSDLGSGVKNYLYY